MNSTVTTMKKRSVKKIIFWVFILFILILTAASMVAFMWFNNTINSPAGNPEEEYSFEVKEGDNFQQLLPKLEDLGVINNAELSRIYLKLNPIELDLLVGLYVVQGGQTLEELVDSLAEGPVQNTVVVTLPEGLRYDEMSTIIKSSFTEFPEALFRIEAYDKIAKNPKSTAFAEDVQKFLDEYKPKNKSLEGFLFPDTYVLATDANAQDIIELQVRTLIRRLEENNINPDSASRLENFYEVLNLASIVEHEAHVYKDQRKVADIFLRRLEMGIMLGSDVTLLYKKKDWTYELRQIDLDNLSDPYNSRALTGLPPTPISNPGIGVIQAVLKPLSNNNLFFIAANGRTYYGITLFDHCQNIQLYMGGSC